MITVSGVPELGSFRQSEIVFCRGQEAGRTKIVSGTSDFMRSLGNPKSESKIINLLRINQFCRCSEIPTLLPTTTRSMITWVTATTSSPWTATGESGSFTVRRREETPRNGETPMNQEK